MASDRSDESGGTVSPASPAWLRYYEAAARRRGAHGYQDHRRLREQRKRRRKLERFGLVASLLGVAILAWIFDAVLSR
jgi:hypothetical protein